MLLIILSLLAISPLLHVFSELIDELDDPPVHEPAISRQDVVDYRCDSLCIVVCASGSQSVKAGGGVERVALVERHAVVRLLPDTAQHHLAMMAADVLCEHPPFVIDFLVVLA